MKFLKCFVMRSQLIIAFIACLIITPAALSVEEKQDDTFNLSTLTCWELTGIELEGRVPALMMIFGYVAGTNGLSTHSSQDIGPALEKVGELCTANPDMFVASAIERVILTATMKDSQ